MYLGLIVLSYTRETLLCFLSFKRKEKKYGERKNCCWSISSCFNWGSIKDNKYKEFAKELYEHGALDKEDFELITNQNKSNKSKDYNTIEKDDLER